MSTITDPSLSTVRIPVGSLHLEADLLVPENAAGIVVFALGHGSSHHRARNRLTAELLGACGCATLLLDLLTEQEEAKDETTCEYRFDIVLLEQRLLAITRWVKAQPELAHLPLGYFGSGAGSAAAFVAAAERGGQIAAIVSRGGRPDLAGSNIFAVKSPTLVLVGELDTEVLALNSEAFVRLPCEKDFKIVRGATHHFEERGALEKVAGLSGTWFRKHFGRVTGNAPIAL